MSTIGLATHQYPQSHGLAASAVIESLIKALVTKGALTSDEASQIVESAITELRQSDASLARGAAQILEHDIAPEFG